MPTLLNRALYDATYKATKDMLKFNWWCPGFVPFLKMIDLPEGQHVYRYGTAKFSDGGYEGARKIWGALEKDTGNRWTGFSLGGPGGKVGLYTTLEAERHKDTLFSELFHYLPTETESPQKSVKYFQFPGSNSQSDVDDHDNLPGRARSNAVADLSPRSPSIAEHSTEKLHFMFSFLLSEKKRVLDLQLPTTPNDESFFITNVFQLAQAHSPGAFLPGRNCVDLYMDPLDASFCRAIGNAVLEEAFVDGFMVTSTRDTRSTSVIFKGSVGPQFDYLQFVGRSSFFMDTSGSFTVAAETFADHQYNDDFYDGNDHATREKERQSKLHKASANKIQAFARSRNARANVHELALLRSTVRDGQRPQID